MKINDLTRSHIYGIAQKTGFQRDTLEKTVRLYYLLKDLSENSLFRDCFVLKGGTAINLAYFNLPRLSVDIDMDFTKSGKMEDLLPLRREIKNMLFNLLGLQGYTVGTQSKEVHTLDQWTFNYKSIGGNNDHIKIELNYGARNHILPIENKDIKLDIVTDAGINVPVLHPCELFATKINALLERFAVRDLFDVYNLSKSNILSSPEEREILKKGIIFYQTIGVEGKGKNQIDLSKIMEVQPSRIKSQLIPLLPSGKKYFPIEEAKENVTRYLKTILILTSEECEYMENFYNNIYKPELLFQNSEILERIVNHPMAIWKTQQ
jgi:predicted nucleotidyltransferase component of viral defense system